MLCILSSEKTAGHVPAWKNRVFYLAASRFRDYIRETKSAESRTVGMIGGPGKALDGGEGLACDRDRGRKDRQTERTAAGFLPI